jgi:lipoyl synthase
MPLVKETKDQKFKKLNQIPVVTLSKEAQKKKPRITINASTTQKVKRLKEKLREHRLVTVCEDASCPNLHECFSKGTATFMIMGDRCTRRCTFCDVAHGKPDPLDTDEPKRLADMIAAMKLSYVVITSVDRDDLRDGGAQHFVDCLQSIRKRINPITLEILVPDFRGRMQAALDAFSKTQPDVFNHNIETVKRLYRQARPGSDYAWSLKLLAAFKKQHPSIPTKSGIMVGLGETMDEITEVMHDLRAHDVDMITIGQYLQPSSHHHPVLHYYSEADFKQMKNTAESLGFSNAACGALVRSSYHADLQAEQVINED